MWWPCIPELKQHTLLYNPSEKHGSGFAGIHQENCSCVRGSDLCKQIGGTGMGIPCAVGYASNYIAKYMEGVLRAEFPASLGIFQAAR